MKLSVLSLLAASSLATASFVKNLNYRSPSENHPSLGISLRKVHKRNTLNKRFDAAQLNFTHGVASGDPYPDSVILWTRISPMLADVNSNTTDEGYVPLYYHGPVAVSTAPVCVEYTVSESSDFSNAACSGKAYTSSDIDYTVKVEASGLKAFTRYYYQFSVCGSSNKSPVGRTKTSPAPNDYVSKVGLAIYSCSKLCSASACQIQN